MKLLKWKKKKPEDLSPCYIGILGKYYVAYVFYDRFRSANIIEEYTVTINLPGLKDRQKKFRVFTKKEGFEKAEIVVQNWIKRAELMV